MSSMNVGDAEATSRQSGQLFVREGTGLVREASALDATIFNAVFSAPIGATLAWGVFFALTAFLGSDLVAVTRWSIVLNIPILIMRSVLASSMPKAGGGYVWFSPILSSPRRARLEPRRRLLGRHRHDVLGALLPGLRRRAGTGDARHDLPQPRTGHRGHPRFQSHFNSLSHHYGAKRNVYQNVIPTAHAQNFDLAEHPLGLRSFRLTCCGLCLRRLT